MSSKTSLPVVKVSHVDVDVYGSAIHLFALLTLPYIMDEGYKVYG